MKKPNDISLGDLAMKALTEAVAEVVEEHRQSGAPLAVWRAGKVVWIPASEPGRAGKPAGVLKRCLKSRAKKARESARK